MGRNRHKTRNEEHPKPQPTQSQSNYSLNSLGESFDPTLWDALRNVAKTSENEQSTKIKDK
jgi:hypothetical protein